MNGLRRNVSVAVLTLVLMAAGVASGDAGVGDSPIAVVQPTSEGLVWQPQREFEQLVLTVAQPNGTIFRQEVGPAESPRMDLFTPDGRPRPEGRYVWELRVKPRIDPRIIEGDFSIQSCSVTIGVGVSVSRVEQGFGRSGISPSASAGLGAGCFALIGSAKLRTSTSTCCGPPLPPADGRGPMIGPRE
jgi:hypothetical protein